MILILLYSNDEQVVGRALRGISHVAIAQGVAVTWEPEEKVTRALERVKEELLERWEAEGSGPVFEYAVIKLTEEQYNALRHMARRALDDSATRLTAELKKLAADMRRGRGRASELKARFRRLAAETTRLNETASKLGLYTSALSELQEAFKEASAEYLKLK
ncbi:MAG: hypothetical protein QXP98_08640 [Thermoproteus sp.]